MTEPASNVTTELRSLTVRYDGACPLCRREIGIYRGLRPLQSGSPVCFADISDAALPLPPGTTREQLRARFHVRSRGGELLTLPAQRRCRITACKRVNQLLQRRHKTRLRLLDSPPSTAFGTQPVTHRSAAADLLSTHADGVPRQAYCIGNQRITTIANGV